MALEAQFFREEGGRQSSTLEFARFAVVMQELWDTREAFDSLVSVNTEQRCRLTAPT
jgi:hypothetical protein